MSGQSKSKIWERIRKGIREYIKYINDLGKVFRREDKASVERALEDAAKTLRELPESGKDGPESNR